MFGALKLEAQRGPEVEGAEAEGGFVREYDGEGNAVERAQRPNEPYWRG